MNHKNTQAETLPKEMSVVYWQRKENIGDGQQSFCLGWWKSFGCKSDGCITLWKSLMPLNIKITLKMVKMAKWLKSISPKLKTPIM